MKSIRLHQSINDPQYISAKEGHKVDRNLSETLFIANLIRGYADHRSDSYHLFVHKLPKYEQIILLSYCISPGELEWAHENPTRLEMVLNEYETDMQSAIDSMIDDVYHSDMDEMHA